MSAPRIILLSNGGMRSLVATAMVLSWPQAQVVSLLHVRREQPAREARLSAVRRQANHFTRCQLTEIEEARSGIAATNKQPPGGTATATEALPIMRLLTLAMTQAVAVNATRIIWPVSFNGEFAQITRAMEQTVLARHLASTEIDNPPVIECPLTDLSNRQIVEMGSHLEVPWQLSWSCDQEGSSQCGSCGGCRKRSAAFAAAGVEDPLMIAKNVRAA